MESPCVSTDRFNYTVKAYVFIFLLFDTTKGKFEKISLRVKSQIFQCTRLTYFKFHVQAVFIVFLNIKSKSFMMLTTY